MKHRPIFSKLSVKWRIFVFFAAFTFLMFGVLWLLQTVFLEKFYESIKVKQMKDAAETVIENDYDFLDETAEMNDASILVFDSSFSQIDVGSSYKNGYILDITPVAVKYIYDTAAANNGEAVLEITGNPENRGSGFKRMIYAKIDDYDNIILVEAVFTSLKVTSEIIRIQLYYVMVIFLVVGMAFALIISKYTSKPIEKLNASAKQLANGNYDVNFNVNGYKEISELSETLAHTSEELSKNELYRRELLANVSHDLRTPLTMISGYAEAMRDIPGELTSENVQIIIDEAAHLTSLVNDLLDLSKIQSGAHMLNKTRFNITKCLNMLLGRYNKLKEQEGFNFNFSFEKEVYVVADEQKITQVAYNLINNAVNYTGEDKNIFITQVIDADKVRIEIADTGAGIPQSKLQYIWDRYYKIDSTHKRAKQGSGIGLSIVKGIMELHNERYGVSSIEGSGSVFWFELTISE